MSTFSEIRAALVTHNETELLVKFDALIEELPDNLQEIIDCPEKSMQCQSDVDRWQTCVTLNEAMKD